MTTKWILTFSFFLGLALGRPLPAAAASPAPPLLPGEAWGYYGGYSQNSMNVRLTNSTTLDLSGKSWNLGAFSERALTQSLGLLVRAGYEGLQGQGNLNSNVCGGVCKVDIGALAAEALAKYSFSKEKQTWWVGGGLGFLYPVLKTSNVLDTGKLSLTEKILFSAGLDWHRTPKNFIPLQVEYALHSSNEIVTTKQLILRLGYGYVF